MSHCIYSVLYYDLYQLTTELEKLGKDVYLIIIICLLVRSDMFHNDILQQNSYIMSYDLTIYTDYCLLFSYLHIKFSFRMLLL